MRERKQQTHRLGARLHPLTIEQNALTSFKSRTTLVPAFANTIGPGLFLSSDRIIGGADGTFGRGMQWQGLSLRMTKRNFGPIDGKPREAAGAKPAAPATPLVEVARLVVPVTTYAEMDGTFVNAKGMAQRFQRAIQPAAGVTPAWQALVCFWVVSRRALSCVKTALCVRNSRKRSAFDRSSSLSASCNPSSADFRASSSRPSLWRARASAMR